MAPKSFQQIKDRFIKDVKHHLSGWEQKVINDFSEQSCSKELEDLENDAIYRDFGFATPQYVAIRMVGRMSISIGRRLGEIYDKVPRFVAAARFGLTDQQVKEKFGRLELDIALREKFLEKDDIQHLNDVCLKYFDKSGLGSNEGIGIEIRYNFNPNDSSRLRKDVDMCSLLTGHKLFPVYLIFSSISPRVDAIKRLRVAGWNFLVGEDAINFLKDLLEVDFQNILRDKAVQAEIKSSVDNFMSRIFNSTIVGQAMLCGDKAGD